MDPGVRRDDAEKNYAQRFRRVIVRHLIFSLTGAE